MGGSSILNAKICWKWGRGFAQVGEHKCNPRNHSCGKRVFWKFPGNSQEFSKNIRKMLGRFQNSRCRGGSRYKVFYLERSGPLGNKPLIGGYFNLPQAPLNCQQPRGWYCWEKKSCINYITWYFISLFARLLNIPGGFLAGFLNHQQHLSTFMSSFWIPFSPRPARIDVTSEGCWLRQHRKGEFQILTGFQAPASMYVYAIFK